MTELIKCAWSKCNKTFPADTSHGEPKLSCCNAHRANASQERRRANRPDVKTCGEVGCAEIIPVSRKYCGAHIAERRKLSHNAYNQRCTKKERQEDLETGIQPPKKAAPKAAPVQADTRPFGKPLWKLRIYSRYLPHLMTQADWDYLDAHHADRAKTIRNLSGLVYP